MRMFGTERLAVAGPELDSMQLARYTSPEFRAGIAGIGELDERLLLLGGLERLHELQPSRQSDGVSPEFAQGVTALSERLGLPPGDRSVGALAFASGDTWDSRFDARRRKTYIGIGETLAAFFGDPTRFVEVEPTLPETRRPRPLGEESDFARLGRELRLL